MAKNKKSSPPVQQLSPTKYITTKSRSLPWGKCYVNDNWALSGMASIIMCRVMPSGKQIVGIYLVDVFCTGLKNTGARFNMDALDFEEFKTSFEQQQELEEANPTLLQNIIYGAIEYAEDLGFQPAKDFSITEYILDPADKIGYIDIDFGKDGKPFYIEGPHDNVRAILKKLDNAVGPNNYEFLSRAEMNTNFDQLGQYIGNEEQEEDDK